MKNTSEINYIKEMIKEMEKAINNASQFGDINTVSSIQNQIKMYQQRLAELEK